MIAKVNTKRDVWYDDLEHIQANCFTLIHEGDVLDEGDVLAYARVGIWITS
jgi:hypothetical protein